MQQLRHARPRLDDESGMTLLEMMAALFILSLTMTALLASVITSLRSLDVSKHRQDATQLASSTLEATRGTSFELVALNSGHASASSLPPDFEGEALVLSPNGALVHEESTPAGFTVTTWVTEVASSTEQRRVSVIVSWDDRGTTRSLRQETLVAEARRGLPAPAFDVGPTPADGTLASSQTQTCVEHRLTNLGEQDKYDWHTAGTLQSGSVDHDGDPLTPPVDAFQTVTSPVWEVWAILDGTPMKDVTGDGRPDAVDFVARNGNVDLELCYRPMSTPPDGVVTFDHTFRSSFDSTVTESIIDRVTVSSTLYRLYLHHPRKNNGDLDVNTTSLLMNNEVPSETNDTINYDPPGGGSPDTRAGKRVPMNTSVVWDYQFQQPATIDDAVLTRLSVAAAGGGDVTYTLRLERRSGQGGGTTTTILAETAPETIAVGATSTHPWTLIDRTLTIDPAVSRAFDQNDYLRLRFTCLPSTECHVHYDVMPNHGSFVETEVFPS